MNPSDSNAAGRLRAAVLEDARRQAGAITAEAAAECAAILKRAEHADEQDREEVLERARRRAVAVSERMRAAIPIAVDRQRAAHIEQIVAAIRDAVRTRCGAPGPATRLEGLVALAVEAVPSVADHDVVIRLSPVDSRLGDALAGAVRGRLAPLPLNLTVVADAAVGDGGVIVESADGARVWDNRPATRLDRMWPELRRQVVAQYLQPDRSGP